MASKGKQRQQTARQKEWEEQNQHLLALRDQAPRLKAEARAKGYQSRYFELLDSYEAIFHELVAEARTRFPSLACVVEVRREQFKRVDFTRHGLPPNCRHIFFTVHNEGAATYGKEEDEAGAVNIAGFTQAHLDPVGRLHTVVVPPKDIECGSPLRDMQYGYKLVALLHELGHVEDLERQINFSLLTETADITAAEVYANRYALAEANRVGLFMVADTLSGALAKYRGRSDYRAAVAERVLDTYQPPAVAKWDELANPTGGDRLTLSKWVK
jgi:hypothetical protein